mmetsp:Transcript_40425/g.52998  ORF Transcript_40425/g.52998 Transcript_40425/m.52998 type:complete len:118 (-) Transcript_40425:365-718(-)
MHARAAEVKRLVRRGVARRFQSSELTLVVARLRVRTPVSLALCDTKVFLDLLLNLKLVLFGALFLDLSNLSLELHHVLVLLDELLLALFEQLPCRLKFFQQLHLFGFEHIACLLDNI